MKANPSSCKGFTLIEVLLALAVGGLLLVAVAALLFSLSNMTLSLRQGDPLQRHTQGLERILYDTFTQATLPPQGEQPNGGGGEDGAVEGGDDTSPTFGTGAAAGQDEKKELLVWQKMDDLSPLTPPLLTLFLPQEPSIIAWEGRSTGGVLCHLYFQKDEGLFLLWSPQLAYVQYGEETPVYQTLLSSYTTLLEYAYYDTEREDWEISDRPKEDSPEQYTLPQALKISLRVDEKERVLWVALPSSPEIPIP